MKFGIVTDIHAGADKDTTRGAVALELLAAALDDMAASGCGFLIDLGDRISERGRGIDLDLLARIDAIFGASGLDRLHLCGNHDLYTLGRDDNARAVGAAGSRLVRREGISLALFDGDMDSVDAPMTFDLSPAGLNTLEGLLNEADGPTLAFNHVPLLSRSMEGNYYFERRWAGAHCYRDAEGIRTVLERAPNLIACFAGHVHWTSHMAIDGIHFVTLGALTETFATYPEAEGAYTIVDLDDRLRVDVRGCNPYTLILPRRPPGHRWVSMDRPCAPCS